MYYILSLSSVTLWMFVAVRGGHGACTVSVPDVPVCLCTGIHTGFTGLPVCMGSVAHVGMSRLPPWIRRMPHPANDSLTSVYMHAVQVWWLAAPVMVGSCTTRSQVGQLQPEGYHMPIAAKFYRPIWAEHVIQFEW